MSRWEGKAGTISVIREYLGLESGRARKQIRDVLKYVSEQRDAGETDIDAGVSDARHVSILLLIFMCPQIKEGAHRSGAKRKIKGTARQTVAKCLRAGLN